jgi:hypothetical protein
MRAVTILSLALLAGCDSGVNSGPLAFGIVSGNNQTATAGSDRLTNPVVGKLVRTPDGGITFNLVRSAYAQGTVVNGSPVPGAVVCAVSISENGMVPWVPCTNTDSAGQATFFFTPGTRADTVRSEIRGTVEGEPAVFDTATALVAPGPLAAWGAGEYVRTSEGDTVQILSAITTARDEYHNAIPVDSLASLGAVWVWRQPDPNNPPSTEVPSDTTSGWSAPVPAGASEWPSGQGGVNAELHVWIDGVMNRLRVIVGA